MTYSHLNDESRQSTFSFNLQNSSFNHGFEPFSAGEKFMFAVSFVSLMAVLAGAVSIFTGV